MVPKSGQQAANGSFTALREFARKRLAEELCEMCSAGLPEEHQHLMELSTRKLVCACDACAVLFSGQASAKFKRIPRGVWFLRDFHMSDAQWENLRIPIELAYICRSSPQGQAIAYYPGPAGAIESLLSLQAWSDIEEANPILKKLVSDVMALLINRTGASQGIAPDFYAVPIDECYKLAGLIRMHWRGLSGGTEVWSQVNGYFASLKSKAEVTLAEPYA